MTDIVERLRSFFVDPDDGYGCETLDMGANEIERLRGALKKIADNPVCLCGQKEMQSFARAALEGK